MSARPRGRGSGDAIAETEIGAQEEDPKEVRISCSWRCACARLLDQVDDGLRGQGKGAGAGGGDRFRLPGAWCDVDHIINGRPPLSSFVATATRRWQQTRDLENRP
jgi:hypothetical protein